MRKRHEILFVGNWKMLVINIGTEAKRIKVTCEGEVKTRAGFSCGFISVRDLKVVANSPERLNMIENPKRYPAQWLKLLGKTFFL